MFSNTRLTSSQEALDLLSRYRDFYETRNLKSYVIGNRRPRQLVLGASEQLESMPTTEGALVLERDPGVDIKNTLAIRQVRKNGRIYDGDTLDEVWPRQRTLRPLWFSDDRPRHAGPDETNVAPSATAPRWAAARFLHGSDNIPSPAPDASRRGAVC